MNDCKTDTLKSFHVWIVNKEDEFSPLKNAESEGVDCLSTCRKALAERTRKWVERAGANVPVEPVYVRSGASYDGEVRFHWYRQRDKESVRVSRMVR